MNKVASKGLRFPFYPWLLGIYPILHLYTENLGLVIDSEVIPSVLLVLAGTSIAFYIINRQIRDVHQTALIIALGSLTFSLSGHIYVLVFMPKSLGIWTMMVMIGLAAVSIGLRKMRPRRFFANTTPSFNVIIIALLSLQVFRLVVDAVELSRYVDVFTDYSALASERPNAPKVEDSAAKPDIYYIIPDGYPSDAWLKTTTNFDNSAFTEALEDRGFVVVDHAQSNYGNTLVSLPATLNMRYYGANPSPYSDLAYLQLELVNSKVARILAELGYTYIQLLSLTFLPSPIADINRDFTPQGVIDIEVDFSTISGELFDENQIDRANLNFIARASKRSFFDAYFDTTLFRLVRSRITPLLHGEQIVPYDAYAPERFLKTIDEVATVSAMPEATFTIMHLLKPHDPVVFNEQGEQIPIIKAPSPDEFIGELRFVNSRFLQMMDSILTSSANPPVIIFQADHGSVLGESVQDNRYTMFDIYAAYYLPPPFSIDFAQPFTSVNTFPLIFNEVFKAEFELQTDKLFELEEWYSAPFAQADVTEEFLNYP